MGRQVSIACGGEGFCRKNLKRCRLTRPRRYPPCRPPFLERGSVLASGGTLHCLSTLDPGHSDSLWLPLRQPFSTLSGAYCGSSLLYLSMTTFYCQGNRHWPQLYISWAADAALADPGFWFEADPELGSTLNLGRLLIQWASPSILMRNEQRRGQLWQQLEAQPGAESTTID